MNEFFDYLVKFTEKAEVEYTRKHKIWIDAQNGIGDLRTEYPAAEFTRLDTLRHVIDLHKYFCAEENKE